MVTQSVERCGGLSLWLCCLEEVLKQVCNASTEVSTLLYCQRLGPGVDMQACGSLVLTHQTTAAELYKASNRWCQFLCCCTGYAGC
jgi:hypothetical protein